MKIYIRLSEKYRLLHLDEKDLQYVDGVVF